MFNAKNALIQEAKQKTAAKGGEAYRAIPTLS
jgi:hypothetical protein